MYLLNSITEFKILI